MAREGISKAQVFNAADAISATGQAPTVAAVRARIGTGSYTTITAHLRAWKEAQDEDPSADMGDVPEAVTAALSRAAEIVWTSAQSHFAAELAAVKRDTQHQVATATNETKDAQAEIARLEGIVDDMHTTRQSLADELATLRTQHHDLTEANRLLAIHLAEATAQLKSAEARIREQSGLLAHFTSSKSKTRVEPKPNARKSKPSTPEAEPDTLTQPLPLSPAST